MLFISQNFDLPLELQKIKWYNIITYFGAC